MPLKDGLINNAPFFAGGKIPTQTISIDMDTITKDTVKVIDLPDILDSGINDTYSITIEGMKSYMSLDSAKKQLTIRVGEMPESDIIQQILKVKLED